ncbi:MAG TPA: sigma-70 region 4 domain-containing protein, partial [Thermoanaerobaculia bacterium]|nr:sigma-70 region 4 domain-containing protein [Thermoanaerobaculia bacterium]
DAAEVVLLRDLQGWSEAETAAYLDVPVGTVKSRLHRARLELAGRVTSRLGAPGAHAVLPELEAEPC